MGTGSRAYRAAYGQTSGEALGIQEHTEAMIEIQGLAFAQQIEQAEELYLLAKRFEDSGQQPIFVPKTPLAEPPPAKSNYMLYIGLAVLAWLFWKGR